MEHGKPLSYSNAAVFAYTVVQSVPADDVDVNPQLPGADVLLKLIGYCDSEPDINTARLLERFRDGDRYNYLVKLAAKSYFPDGGELDQESAILEFTHCMRRLRERSQQKLADKVDISARKGLLGLGRR